MHTEFNQQNKFCYQDNKYYSEVADNSKAGLEDINRRLLRNPSIPKRKNMNKITSSILLAVVICLSCEKKKEVLDSNVKDNIVKEREHPMHIGPILWPEHLDFINIPHQELDTIEGIEEYTHVKTIMIDQNPIKSIDRLRNLINLDFLAIDKTLVTDLTPLENLINLKSLNIEETKIVFLKGVPYTLEKLIVSKSFPKEELVNYKSKNPNCIIKVCKSYSERPCEEFKE